MKNGKRFVDLREVERITVGVFSFRGISQSRLGFHSDNGVQSIEFNSGWKRERNAQYSHLQEIVLKRYSEVCPDGEIDFGGDRRTKAWNAAVALALVGAGLVFLLSTFAFELGPGSEAAQLEPAMRFVVGIGFLLGGVIWLEGARSNRRNAREAVAEDRGKKAIAGVVAFLVFAFVTTEYGPMLFGQEPVTVSDVGMNPTYTTGSRLWAVTDVDSVSKLDVVAIDTTGLGRPELPETIVRRVAAVEGQRVEAGFIWIRVDGVWYSHGATGGEVGEWSDVVRDGHVFVMSDNRDFGNDSRDLGQIPEDAIIGVVR